MGERNKMKNSSFISSKANDIKSKIYNEKAKNKDKDACEEMRLEHSEELSPDDFE